MARAKPRYAARQCDRCASRSFATQSGRWRGCEADPHCARCWLHLTRGGGSVKGWWQRRSVRFRLALWYAAATALVLIAFAWFVYEVIEHRLAAEIDRQLRIDFDLVEAQLGVDMEGHVVWTVRGSHGDEGFARMSAWFEVWSENRELLLRHWPVPEANSKDALPPPQTSTLRFATIELERGLFLRV